MLKLMLMLFGTIVATGNCYASQLTYSFTGTGSGTLGGVSFSSALYNFSLLADTATIQHSSQAGGAYYVNGILSYSIAGLGTGTSINPVSVFSEDSGRILIGFMVSVFPSDNVVWGAKTGVPFYDLSTVYAPLLLSDFFRTQPDPLSTSGGALSMSSVSSVTFQATSAVPEPSTGGSIGGGLLLVLTGVVASKLRMRKIGLC